MGSHRRRDTLRLDVYRALVAAAFVLLVGRLWRLQVVQGSQYQQAADVNRFRLEPNPAPRGVIYDRRGYLLVRNVPRLTVSIVPAYLPEDDAERRALLIRLSRLLDMPMARLTPGTLPSGQIRPGETPFEELQAGILDLLEEAALAPYRPVSIKTNVARDVAMILEEEHLDWPGVLVQVEAQREYVYGSLVSHMLGYVGPIPAAQSEAYEAEGYDVSSARVGLAGVEYSFEAALRGVNGHKLIEVDVAGRGVRTVGEPKAVVPGNNLRLALDLSLQREIEAVLKQALRALPTKQAVVIAEDPRSGEVLAMASLPSYDDNAFAGGISYPELEALRQDPNRPLVNHAISGMFPPGSTFKIIVAAAGLEEGVISVDTRLSCSGILWLPNRFYPEDPSLAQPFYCWIHKYHGGHGALGVVSALAQSCDIYYYQVGGGYRSYFEGLSEERVAYYAELFGLGQRTGIDLPGEGRGLVPSPTWKRVNYSESWSTGDTYNMAIGQGFVLATPLQMVNAAAAIANGGTLYRPQVVREVLDGEGRVVVPFVPDVIRAIPVSPEYLAVVRQGMRAAVAGPGGTASALNLPGLSVAGKTGTAEFFIDRNKDGIPDRDREGNLPTHAWFIGYAPYENPEIVLLVFVFGGGEGSGTAVPIARDILRYYFEQDQARGGP